MSEMSPLGRLILRAMRAGSFFVAACVLIFMAILVWQKWLSQAAPAANNGDFVFLGVLAVLFIGALWLARSVGKELKR